MPALPPAAKLPDWIQKHLQSHEIISAYNLCLQLESWIQYESGFRGQEKAKALIQCRILGYLIYHFPCPNIGPFVMEIVTINGKNEALLALGERYYVYFVKLLMSNKGHTPAPSSHPSRRSVDDLVAKIKEELKDAPPNHQTAKKNALIRDGFQCVVTKMYDINVVENSSMYERIAKSGCGSGSTECAHIFPESINSDTTSGSKNEDYAASVWAVLDRFSHDKLRKDLNGAGIHRLDNVMTMAHDIHGLFDRLKVCFTATEVSNRYLFEAIRDYAPPLTTSRYVTFTTPDAEKYPLPNSTYLAIHAACAKVAHLSGAAEHIEKVLRDMEDTRVLARDGGSSEVLYTAMLSSMRTVNLGVENRTREMPPGGDW